ncbi:MAG TPA: phosphatase PAP2 family protein [Propylenella sp.]
MRLWRPSRFARLRIAAERAGRRWPLVDRYGAAMARIAWKTARAELAILVTFLIVAGGVWAFVLLAGEVAEGETEAFDRAVLLAFRSSADPSDPIGPGWLEEAVRDVTALGSNVVLTFVTLAVIGYLVLARKRGAALLVAASVGGGTLIGTLLKAVFQRPRPDLVPHGMDIYTASFPSNHAMLSAVTYLTLGALLARLHDGRAIKIYFLLLSVLLTVMVGLSRIHLGVHWPTDVLAGWAIGAAWAMGVWLAALLLQRRGAVERPGG